MIDILFAYYAVAAVGVKLTVSVVKTTIQNQRNKIRSLFRGKK